jgi:hypothetical protein
MDDLVLSLDILVGSVGAEQRQSELAKGRGAGWEGNKSANGRPLASLSHSRCLPRRCCKGPASVLRCGTRILFGGSRSDSVLCFLHDC